MNLIDEVENILERSDFDYCRYSGCFDLAANREFTVFIKILENVDSFQWSQATNLKIVSKNFNAAVALIGRHTRRENLMNSVVYERFDIPTLTPATLEDIFVNDTFPTFYRQRGGMFAEINPEMLRKKRKLAGMSQSKLAQNVGITKKSIYEHEREKKKALYSIVKRIESLLGNVTVPAVLRFEYSSVHNIPKNRFEKKVRNDLNNIGFQTDVIYQTPFNMLAKNHSMMIISRADENRKHIERAAPHIASFAEMMHMPALAVTSEELNIDIPSITETELKGMQSTRDLRKLLL